MSTKRVEFQQNDFIVSFGDNLAQNDFYVDFGENIAHDDYSGPYEVTPSEETQMLITAGKTLAANVVVNPIPNNYGRIAWNGSSLSVY